MSSAGIALTEIFARARTLATQISGDATQSPLIDNLAGLRALLNHCILEVYRRKAANPKFLRDITIEQTVAISSGSGNLPSNIMYEYLGTGNFTDDNNALVTYYEYASDYNSTVNFTQLGYCFLVGNTLKYTAPAPDFDTYTGNLFITSPCLPAITDEVAFQTEETGDDVILLLAKAIRGEVSFEGIDVAAAA